MNKYSIFTYLDYGNILFDKAYDMLFHQKL